MTQTMTKEQILETYFGVSAIKPTLFMEEMALKAMEEYAQQQLSAERERAGKLVDTLKYAQTKFYENSIVYNSIKQTLNEYDTATKES